MKKAVVQVTRQWLNLVLTASFGTALNNNSEVLFSWDWLHFCFLVWVRSFSLTLGTNLVSLLWQTLRFGFSTVQTLVEEVDEKRDKDFQGNPV